MAYDAGSIGIAEIREHARYGGLRVTPVPQEAACPTLLDDLPPPRLRVYPRAKVVAAKRGAIVSSGMANSRMTDFFDLCALKKVERPGAAPRSRAPDVPRDNGPHSPHRPTARRSFAGAVITALLLAGVGGYAFVQFSGARSGVAPSVPRVPAADAPQEAAQAFRCDGRTHCSQMTSCDEAKFFLKNCPGTQMDGDRDGIPCEWQWCTGPFGR